MTPASSDILRMGDRFKVVGVYAVSNQQLFEVGVGAGLIGDSLGDPEDVGL